MTYTNTYDEKIMNWNRRDFSMLVEQMDECEIQEMNRWLLCEGIEIDSDCYTYVGAGCFPLCWNQAISIHISVVFL